MHEEWFESMPARQRALEQARTLQDGGIDRIDFLYGYYNDETRVIAAKGFDASGQALRDRPDVQTWAEWRMVETVPGWPSHAMGSYSPRHHQAVQIGEIDYNDSYEGIEYGESKHPLPVAHAEAPDLVAMLTWHPDLPDDLVRRGALDDRAAVRAAVASNPTTPADLLGALAGDADMQVRRGVALNAAAPADVLIRLAEDPDLLVRDALASNYNAPADALTALATGWSVQERDEKALARKAMQHPRFPLDWLLDQRRSASDVGLSLDAHVAVALHADATSAHLDELAASPSKEVRHAVANTASGAVRVATLARLLKDLDGYVRSDAHHALRRLDLSQSERADDVRRLLRSSESSRALCAALQGNPTVTPEMARLMAGSDPWSANWASWRLPELDPDRPPSVHKWPEESQLRAWAASEKWDERHRAARTPATPLDALLTLLEVPGLFDDFPDESGGDFDQYQRVSTCVALCGHPSLPLRVLMGSTDERRRRAAARQTRASADELTELARDPAWIVRWSVASNPNTPTTVLDILGDDEHETVRNRARSNLAAPLTRRFRPDWPKRDPRYVWRRGLLFEDPSPTRRPVPVPQSPSARQSSPVAAPSAAQGRGRPTLRGMALARAFAWIAILNGTPIWVCGILWFAMPLVSIPAVRTGLKALLSLVMLAALVVAKVSAEVGRRHANADGGTLTVVTATCVGILSILAVLLGGWTLIYR